jgi:phytoene dehydrogenase-like protein
MARHLMQLGGEIVTNRRIEALDEFDDTNVVLFDLTPKQILAIAGKRFSDGYRRRLADFRYGPGVFKVDYALDGPVPWSAEECRRAGTLHLGGMMREIIESEAAIANGRVPDRPYVLVAQQSLFDSLRAPDGKHTLWAYCHLPHGSAEDMTARIEAQVERFAPGFQRRIQARHSMSPIELEAYNENYVGGDIAGGSHAGLQLLLRPTPSLSPYRTSDPRLFLCSASTPPGAGVHGMCGYFAANAALRAGLN